MLDREEVNVVSLAAGIQHRVDPALDSGRATVAGVCGLLVPGTVHIRIVEELLLLKLSLSHRLKLHEAFLLLGLRPRFVGQLKQE